MIIWNNIRPTGYDINVHILIIVGIILHITSYGDILCRVGAISYDLAFSLSGMFITNINDVVQ